MLGSAVAEAARDLVGTPFRLQGRDERGVDCVGLVQLAITRAGFYCVAPDSYSLRMGDAARASSWLVEAGMEQVDAPVSGDVALVRPAPLHLHVMIFVGDGHVHAHAGLRRVVAMPGASPWEVVGYWRIRREMEQWRLSS